MSERVLWGLCQATLLVMLFLIFRRRAYRAFPWFTAYLILNLGQAAVLFFLYYSGGYSEMTVFLIGWLTQALVVAARAVAVGELCGRILGAFAGVWRLAVRLLVLCALLVVLYSFYVADWRWEGAIYAVDRGLELAVACVIVLLFTFARYYKVPISSADRAFALGFCVYSFSTVLGSTILEALSKSGADWNIWGMSAFLGSLLIWTRALRSAVHAGMPRPALIGSGVYQELSPEINLRLRKLNKQLLAFWKLEAPTA